MAKVKKDAVVVGAYIGALVSGVTVLIMSGQTSDALKGALLGALIGSITGVGILE